MHVRYLKEPSRMSHRSTPDPVAHACILAGPLRPRAHGVSSWRIVASSAPRWARQLESVAQWQIVVSGASRRPCGSGSVRVVCPTSGVCRAKRTWLLCQHEHIRVGGAPIGFSSVFWLSFFPPKTNRTCTMQELVHRTSMRRPTTASHASHLTRACFQMFVRQPSSLIGFVSFLAPQSRAVEVQNGSL